MVVYGVAILSICMLVGIVVGEILGALIGIEANVGGVGIAMLLLIILADRFRVQINLDSLSGRGISFFSAMYIPICVAMAARQNVYAAINGGAVSILAGSGAVALGFVMVPLINKLIKKK